MLPHNWGGVSAWDSEAVVTTVPVTPYPVILCTITPLWGGRNNWKSFLWDSETFSEGESLWADAEGRVPLSNSSRSLWLHLPSLVRKPQDWSVNVQFNCFPLSVQHLGTHFMLDTAGRDKMKPTRNMTSCYLGFGVGEGERRHTDDLRKGRLC